MHQLIPLSEERTETVDRGPAKGQSTVIQTVLAADNWNWVIGILHPHKTKQEVKGEKFYGNMRLLLPALLVNKDVTDFPAVLKALVLALSQRLSVPPVQVPEIKDDKAAAAFGKLLDDKFNTSFMREHPPTVYKRIFGKPAKD